MGSGDDVDFDEMVGWDALVLVQKTTNNINSKSNISTVVLLDC